MIFKGRTGEWHIDQGDYGIEFYHDDYDGAPDAYDNRCGTAPSKQEALERIKELEDDELESLAVDKDIEQRGKGDNA